MREILGCTGFEWDDGNIDKNWITHRVSTTEAEQVFFNRPLVIASATRSPDWEHRYYLLGQTDEGRRLFVVFTVRGPRIRVISARDMSRRERRSYEDAKEAEEEDS